MSVEAAVDVGLDEGRKYHLRFSLSEVNGRYAFVGNDGGDCSFTRPSTFFNGTMDLVILSEEDLHCVSRREEIGSMSLGYVSCQAEPEEYARLHKIWEESQR